MIWEYTGSIMAVSVPYVIAPEYYMQHNFQEHSGYEEILSRPGLVPNLVDTL